MYQRVKFRHVQCFVEIANEGSLKLAAGKLSLTQPAISKTLKELEDLAGAQLMVRNRSGVTLTRQGEIFLRFARMSVANIQQAFDRVARTSKQFEEQLLVGSLPSVAARLMPDVVAEFSQLAPDAQLKIFDGPHSYLVERLRLGTLDLVVGRLGEPDTMQGITFTQLYTERVEFVVRAGHPFLEAPEIENLADWPVIFPPKGSAIRPLVERMLLAHGIGELPNQLETVSGPFGRTYARRTDAVWIISGGVVANEIADGHLVRLPFDTKLTEGPVGLMTRPDVAPSSAMQLFELAMQNVLQNENIA